MSGDGEVGGKKALLCPSETTKNKQTILIPPLQAALLQIPVFTELPTGWSHTFLGCRPH